MRYKNNDNFNSGSGSQNGNRTVSQRIFTLTLTTSAITLILGAASIFSLIKVDENAKTLNEVYLSEWSVASAFSVEVRKAGYDHNSYTSSGNKEDIELALSRFEDIYTYYDQMVALADNYELPVLEENLIGLKDEIDIYKRYLEEYSIASTEVKTNQDSSQFDILNQVLTEARKKAKNEYSLLLTKTTDVVQSAERSARKVSSNTEETAYTFIWVISTLSFISVLMGIIFGLVTGRKVSNILQEIIEKLKGGSEQVSAASDQLSSSSQSLAESSSEQAASLQETASSLEEMSSQIKSTAQNSVEAELLMKESKPLVENGVKAMYRMSEAMGEIKDSSQETSNIVKSIDDIAFQTNLLALNAAVEAARAGEAGKGFAVVAEEVRNLAQRSADAAKVTSELIQRSQETSARGAAVADEVSDNLEKIESSIANVSTLVLEISAASKEQAEGIQQMNSAMSEMDTVVQDNASASEESASSAEELSSQAKELDGIVTELVGLVGGGGNTSYQSLEAETSLIDRFENFDLKIPGFRSPKGDRSYSNEHNNYEMAHYGEGIDDRRINGYSKNENYEFISFDDKDNLNGF